jgi:hypothetical protein
VNAPDRLAGKRVKCLPCGTFFTLSGSGPDGTAARPAEGPAVTGAARVAFWLGLTALALGVAAAVTGLFPAAAGWSQPLAWLGIALGGGSVVLAIVREECGFGLPFTGSVASLLSLALVVFWLGAAGAPGEDRGGPGGGPPDRRGQGPPPDWKGGPPRGRDKDGPLAPKGP